MPSQHVDVSATLEVQQLGVYNSHIMSKMHQLQELHKQLDDGTNSLSPLSYQVILELYRFQLLLSSSIIPSDIYSTETMKFHAQVRTVLRQGTLHKLNGLLLKDLEEHRSALSQVMAVLNETIGSVQGS